MYPQNMACSLTTSLHSSSGFIWLSIFDCSVHDPVRARTEPSSLPCLYRLKLCGARLVLYGNVLHTELMVSRVGGRTNADRAMVLNL